MRSTSSEARPISRGGDLEEGVTTLLAAGYDQLLQIDFPGSDDGLVSGNWPLGTAMFHVLVRTTEHGHEWRYFWEP